MGESSRMAYERSKDQLEDYRDSAKDSHMNNHAIDKHGGRKDVKYKFVVVIVL